MKNVKKNFSGLIFISCLTMDPTHNTIKRTANIFKKPSTDFKKQTVNLFSELWLKEKKVSKQNTLLCGPLLKLFRTYGVTKIPSEIKNNLCLLTSQTNLTFSFKNKRK